MTRTAIALSGIFFFAFAGASAKTPEAAAPALEIAPCAVEGLPANAECGRITVFENRAAKSGRKIPIEFVRVRATGPDASPYPVFNLDGGPGQNSTENAAGYFRPGAPPLTHDEIIFDQRGTGKSNGLDCIDYDLTVAGQFEQMFEDRFFDPAKYRTCLDQFKPRADLRFYTTSLSADDVDELAAALGYDKIVLDGASYGTTLGLEIMRRHPERVYAAVLRGVAPPASIQTETLARDMEDMLEKLFSACEADAYCAQEYPNFRTDFAAIAAQVRKGAVEVTLPHTLTGAPTQVRLTYPQFVTAIRYALYSTELSAGLPLAISRAKAGDYKTVAALLPRLLYFLSKLASEGMWASVRCAEEFPFLDVGRARRLAEGTVIGQERINSGLAICSFWPRGAIPKNFRAPVVSDAPALLIAGEVDAATPPSLALDAVKYLKNGRLVLVPNASHWELSSDCVETIVDAFLKDPAAPIDEACAKENRRPPFAAPEAPAQP